MGEAKRREQNALCRVGEVMGLETAGGRVQLRWDDKSAVTPFGQMAFFIEFLTLTGLLEDWIKNCPLSYAGHNAPGKRDVLKLVRGDCGFGNDPVMAELESRGVSYLFKLRLTKNVMRYIGKSFGMTDWSDAGQGWEGRDGRLQLTGWSSERRVVILRRPLRGDVLLSPESAQLELAEVFRVTPNES